MSPVQRQQQIEAQKCSADEVCVCAEAQVQAEEVARRVAADPVYKEMGLPKATEAGLPSQGLIVIKKRLFTFCHSLPAFARFDCLPLAICSRMGVLGFVTSLQPLLRFSLMMEVDGGGDGQSSNGLAEL